MKSGEVVLKMALQVSTSFFQNDFSFLGFLGLKI